MNRHSDIERVITVWLSDGPAAITDRFVDDVAARIGAQQQRRGWPRGRRTPMTPIRLIAALAAVLVVAIAGYNLVPRQPVVGGPSAAPTGAGTPSETATPAPSAPADARPCDDEAADCAGLLPAGTAATRHFQPPFSFTVGDGWFNGLDSERLYHLVSDDLGYITVRSHIAIPEQDAECSPRPKSGVGNRVDDWVSFLTNHPGLVTTKLVPISIGAFEGVRVDVHVADDWRVTCPRSLHPAVLIMTDSGPDPELTWWLDGRYASLWIVDVAGETVVVLEETSYGGGTLKGLATLNEVNAPVIDSIVFAP